MAELITVITDRNLAYYLQQMGFSPAAIPAAPTDFAISATRVATFTPASGRTGTDYIYSVDAGTSYNPLPSPTVVNGKLTFTVPGTVSLQVLLRLTAIGPNAAGFPAMAIAPAISTGTPQPGQHVAPVQLMAFGDSNSTDFMSRAWPRQITDQLDLSQFNYAFNLSVGGDRITNAIQRYPGYRSVWKKAAFPEAVGIVYLGVNNTIDEMPVTDMVTQYKQLTALMRADGVLPIYVTFHPWRGEFDATSQTGSARDTRSLAVWQAINEEMVQNGVSQHGFAKVVDIRQDPYIGTAMAPVTGRGTYFGNDQLHLLTAGQEILGQYMATAITELLGTLTPPVVPVDTVGYTTLVGMKYSNGVAIRDKDNAQPGGERLSVAKAFGLPITNKELNTFSFPIYAQNMRSVIVGINNRTDNGFTDNSYYGLFAGEGVFFDTYNEVFFKWHNGAYEGNSYAFTEGQIMTLQYDGLKLYVLLDGVFQFDITLPNPNVANSYIAVWRAPARFGPAIIKGENLVAQTH